MKPVSSIETRRAGPEADIGRAFRWSIVALVLVILGTLSLLLKTAPKKSGGQTPAVPATKIPSVRFTNITRPAGIRFRQHNGAYGEKLLPETMGGGCAFFDFDRDGHPDLLFVDSGDWPWHPIRKRPTSTLVLYRNTGHGHFEDVTKEAGLVTHFYGMGVAVGDYDNDGFPDLFVTGVGGNHLFHNQHGHFTDVTASAGVGGRPENWSTSAAWFDYDNDGDLDLFVCNYVRWSRKLDEQIDYRLAGIGRAYGPPFQFPGTFPYLYRNDGHGHFTDVSAASGVQVRNPATGLPLGKSLGVAPVDLDHDGWIDLVIANDTVRNFVFHNQHNGTFKEIGQVTGTAFDNFGKARGAMGIDAARIQADDSLAISIGNFANEMTAIYMSQQNPLLFTDQAIQQGIGWASRLSLTFGVFFFDYDLDGWLDLLTVNGHIENDIQKVQPDQRYRQPAQLFWNTASAHLDQGFVPVPPERSGRDLFQPIVGRGSAYADIDGDGDLDVVMTQINGPPLLLRNDQNLGHHWIRLKLVGTRSNRDAIGAWIEVRCQGRNLWRQVMPTRGYLSQSELPVTIGLGGADHIDGLTVFWPGAAPQKVASVPLERLTTIVQPR